MGRPNRPVRVAIVNDYEIVVAGIAAALTPFSDRVQVVDVDAGVPGAGEVDIVLRDAFGVSRGDVVHPHLPRTPNTPKVVAFSWSLEPELVARAIDRGASGYIAKSASAEEIVAALERVHAGERVTELGNRTASGTSDGVTWAALEHGLSDREADVLALIAQGLSNREIARRCCLSINSIKTYIRTAYRKIGVSRRAEAVRWGIEQGLEPDPSPAAPARDPGYAGGTSR
ncbi:MAG: regulatory protein LuxR [Nocardioides sp.]|nr:regulatory protein LuxR [Nocardioides sp.]